MKNCKMIGDSVGQMWITLDGKRVAKVIDENACQEIVDFQDFRNDLESRVYNAFLEYRDSDTAEELCEAIMNELNAIIEEYE